MAASCGRGRRHRAEKLILYYFSAHWCGPCRKFTPQLIDYYNRAVVAHPEVESVFYSFDHTQERHAEIYGGDGDALAGD